MHTSRHTRKNSSFSTQDEHLGLLGLEALTEAPNFHYATRSNYNEWEGRIGRFAESLPPRAALEVKLKWRDSVIGTLYVGDKVGRKFTEEDANVLSLFADQAAISIVNMASRTRWERLVANSPNGIVEVDRQGYIAVFNERAQEILGYKEEEVICRHVKQLYQDPNEPVKIGEQLRKSPDGQLKHYETLAKHKNGDSIPVRVSVTKLYDDQGICSGSVGYFEDLRSMTIKEVEGRLNILLQASNTVAGAGNLSEGLNNLAKLMVSVLKHTFCRILLIDEKELYLTVKAACFSTILDEPLHWKLSLRKKIAVDAIPEWD